MSKTVPKTVMFCPDCRNRSIRRRKRSNLTLYLVSLVGKWPYHCEECGSDFLLPKRYLRPRDREGNVMHSAAPVVGETPSNPE